MFQKAKIFSLKCACNYLRFGDATFSVFICNFFQKVLAKNSQPKKRKKKPWKPHVSRVFWCFEASINACWIPLSLGRPSGTSKNTRENWDGFAFSARFCLILAVSVSKNRDSQLQLKPRMEWGFAAYVLHTHCIPGRWNTMPNAGILTFCLVLCKITDRKGINAILVPSLTRVRISMETQVRTIL